MKCSLILFSPTGGTERAAKLLCSGLSDNTQVYDISDRSFNGDSFAADENGVAVIAVPSFGGRVPALAAERIKSIKGKEMPCALLCVYGNRAYDDTLVEMYDLAKECGFNVIAAAAAVAEHSIVRRFAAGRPDTQDEANLKEIGKRIAQKAEQPQKFGEFIVPGNRPYKNAGGAALLPKAGSACVGCGKCAEICPVGAIDKSNLKKTDKSKCISCMRCVSKCPHNARTVNSAMVSAASLALKKACSIRKECEIYM